MEFVVDTKDTIQEIPTRIVDAIYEIYVLYTRGWDVSPPYVSSLGQFAAALSPLVFFWLAVIVTFL
jgi:hypothetical protein